MKITSATYQVESSTLTIRRSGEQIAVRTNAIHDFSIDAELLDKAPTEVVWPTIVKIAKCLYGVKGGRPLCTNSEVHELYTLICSFV